LIYTVHLRLLNVRLLYVQYELILFASSKRI
jgi:hypothetical protein